MSAERQGLPDRIGDAMVARTSPERMQRIWRGVGGLREARRRRRDVAVRAGGLAVAAAALLALGYFGGRAVSRDPTPAAQTAAPRGEIRFAGGGALPVSLAGERVVELDDGSRVSLAGARVEVVENGADDFVMTLHEGRVRYAVRPGGPRAWWIECGLATVRVVGTRFELERGATSLRVTVDEGAVSVRSHLIEGGVRILRGGEEVQLSEPVTPPADVSVQLPVEVEAADAARARAMGWQRMAERGDYERAWRVLGERGIAERTPTASAAQLLALADVARHSGHEEAALAPLERLLDRYPEDPDAALGAFTLGRIRDRRGQPRAAAAAFERALALPLPRSLVGDATARLAQARAASGDAAGASAAAADYLRSSPNGPRAAAMRALASPP